MFSTSFSFMILLIDFVITKTFFAFLHSHFFLLMHVWVAHFWRCSSLMVSIVWNFIIDLFPFLLLTFFVNFRSLVPNISVMRIYIPSSFAPSIV